ncbi:MAG: hypothetical protein HQM09_10655 [Candidatus Riflebacteria bacterium]|nr:hypothetical protein [Candidatus Riflebacteria bacterium]
MENPDIPATPNSNNIVSTMQNHAAGNDQFENTLMLTGIIGFCLVILGSFIPYCQFPVAGATTWFAGGHGAGALVSLLAIAGIFCYMSKQKFVPLAISFFAGFLFIIETVITYDMVAIKNGATSDATAPFRNWLDIFHDACRIGNGASFIFLGFAMVLISSFMAISIKLRKDHYGA